MKKILPLHKILFFIVPIRVNKQLKTSTKCGCKITKNKPIKQILL